MKIFVCCLLSLVSARFAAAQVPYDYSPDWFSFEHSYYGTGCALDDINGDGLIDLAVSNGNDMAEAPNLAYLNVGGALPETASWVSSNYEYSGQCDLGDFDADGYPELAVANYISPGWGPNLLNVYQNNGGSLETTPSWLSADSVYSFRLAWGDANGDGDLDLAVATGEAYNDYLRRNLIYLNAGGVLQTTPGWQSGDSSACYDVQWVDVDNDGDLDLAFCESVGRIKMYYNYGDSIATSPGWRSASDDNYNSFDFADIDGDGYLDLAAAANTQLGGSGRFKIFRNINGILETTPFWQSATRGYGSEAAFADVDNDGDLDLVCGRWWGQIFIYLNNDGNFNTAPDWASSPSHASVVENIVFGDIDGRGVRAFKATFLAPHAGLLYLPKRQLTAVDSVKIDGVSQPLAAYCKSLWSGWVSTSIPMVDSVEIFYRNSALKDMAVSNWDTSTFIFYNTTPLFLPGDANNSGDLNGLDVVFLVNYLKGLGPAPDPFLAGDANGSCDVNGLDVVYLVNYFKGGPEPFAGNCR